MHFALSIISSELSVFEAENAITKKPTSRAGSDIKKARQSASFFTSGDLGRFRSGYLHREGTALPIELLDLN